MPDELSIPPRTPKLLAAPATLATRLSSLVGKRLVLTGKTRTDGSNARKAVAAVLLGNSLPTPASPADFVIVPPKCKGVPRMLREYVDTYIVTTGASYNLQVWNRNPASNSVQVEYVSGEKLLASDVRFVFVKIEPSTHIIESILVLTPDYIVTHFGEFGKPTIKHQIIISGLQRQKILRGTPAMIFHTDTATAKTATTSKLFTPTVNIHSEPKSGQLMALEIIRDKVAIPLIGTTLKQAATKNRGQALEMQVATMLGYTVGANDLMAGGFPDIRHQALEVKVQDSPTVDLGRHSPAFEEQVGMLLGLTTLDVRYLIALTNSTTNVIEGVVLCPGSQLGTYFSFVADTSYKCQRSIPMSFFQKYRGKSVFNP